MAELYVAAARDLPIAFHGPIAVRVLVGGSSKPAWTSPAVEFDKFCAWDFRNPEHTFTLPGTSSLVLEVVMATKGPSSPSQCFFFFESSCAPCATVVMRLLMLCSSNQTSAALGSCF
jgi:hypothetical protein